MGGLWELRFSATKAWSVVCLLYTSGEKTPFRQIASLLIAGTYYLVLHRHTSTFGDMDYDTPDGPVRLKKVLHEILDMLYERLERPQRVSAVSYTHLDVYKRQIIYRVSCVI